KSFYERLRENGNQYGARFQNVSAIWRAGDQSLGRLSVARPGEAIEAHYLHPSMLDAMTQLMAPFIIEQGKTFILRSIEKIEIADIDFPDTLWGHAVRLPESDRDGSNLIGNVRIFDPSGKAHVKLSGIAFTLLDRVDAADDAAAASLVIASSFTAEPIEDSLKFWADHFGVPIRIEFAPYNQIFQQLLAAGSAFRKNRD